MRPVPPPAGKWSFDFVSASLREALTPLKMTGCNRLCRDAKNPRPTNAEPARHHRQAALGRLRSRAARSGQILESRRAQRHHRHHATLLNYWFETDHKLNTGSPSNITIPSREAIETLIYVWEVEKVRTRKDLLERYAQNVDRPSPSPDDDFARYCTKMATGSGKTKVMSLAIAWQYFNAMREQDEIAKDYAKTFLLIAPNVIVLERLKTDFASGRHFPRTTRSVPKEFDIFWDFDCVMRGEGERAHSEGTSLSDQYSTVL